MTVPVTRYFHGGIPGLEVGDRILPPSVTGTPTTADYAAAPICRRDRVYASTELRIARVYAALATLGGHGDVYQVALQDPNERDGAEVGAGGDSVCAPSATVIRIVERDVDLEIARREIAAEFLRHRPQSPRIRRLPRLVRPPFAVASQFDLHAGRSLERR
jgi:hypothetical protein